MDIENRFIDNENLFCIVHYHDMDTPCLLLDITYLLLNIENQLTDTVNLLLDIENLITDIVNLFLDIENQILNSEKLFCQVIYLFIGPAFVILDG